MKALKTIGQVIFVNIKELYAYVGAAFGGGAIGALIALIIIKTLTDGDKTGYVTLGTAFALGMVGIILIFGQSLGGQADFYVAVSMNRSRIPYLLGRYLLLVMDIFVALAGCFAVHLIETKLLGPAIAKGGEITVLIKNISPWLVIGLALVIPLVIIFCTAMYVIFERKFFWAIWAVYMIIALGAPRIGTAMEKNPDSIPAKIGQGFEAFFSMGTLPLIVIGLVIAAIFLVADVILFKKMEVKM